MSRDYDEDEAARDRFIELQPILWAQMMLEQAEKVTQRDARDAILARIGSSLVSRFGVTWNWDEMRRANQRWTEHE